MTECSLCAQTWRAHAFDGGGSRHPECLGVHEGRAAVQVGVGPVSEFGWLHTGGPPAAYARGPAPASAQLDSDESRALLTGVATDEDSDLAATKAIAELFERQTAFLRPRARVRFGASAQLAPETIRVDDELSDRWWVEGRSLRDGRIVFVPAGRFVLASQATAAEDRVDNTGLAVGVGQWHAVVAGVQEAVERVGVSAMLRDGPTWRAASDDCAGSYRHALVVAGWRVDVVGCRYGGFVVSLCVASRTDIDVVIGGSAARISRRDAITAAVMEAYTKSLAFQPDSFAHASSSPVGAIEVDWHRLPAADDAEGDLPDDPLDVLLSGPLDAVFVDRGNPVIDGLGWSAAHVVLLDVPQVPPLTAAWTAVLG